MHFYSVRFVFKSYLFILRKQNSIIISFQLWTIYLEFMAGQQGNIANAEQQAIIFNVLVDFWSKITPSVLQLVAHSSVVNLVHLLLMYSFTEHFLTFQLTEMVNLHFLSLMEALAECKSTVLSLLLPLWTPVLQAQNSQVCNCS